MNKKIFVDSGFGHKGYWAWFILLCLIGLVYKTFTLTESYFISHKNIPEVIIFCIFTFDLFLVILGMVFVVQGLKTAQRIELEKGKLDVVLYFGRRFQIDVSNIYSVEEETQKNYLKSFVTPLGRGGKIYKVKTKNISFYFNTVMDNSHLLVEVIS